MATSTERVRLTGESGTQVVSVEAKGAKNALTTCLVDASGNQITDFGSDVTIAEDSYTLLTADDAEGRAEYLGWAEAGSDTAEGRADTRWKLLKISYSVNGVPSIRWAGGVTTFTNIWDNRAAYTYS